MLPASFADRGRSARRSATHALAVGWAVVSLVCMAPWVDAQDDAPRLDSGALEIVQPPAGLPIFDQVEVEVRVPASLAVAELRLEVDGREAARLVLPPWRVTIDVGSENREREIVAIARLADGSELRATRRTAAIRIDDSLDLGLQQLYVTVTDRRGELRKNLPRTAFRIEDANAPQELVTFAAGDVPFTAALLLDASSSMVGERLDASRRGIERFVGGMGDLDLARLLVFADRLLDLSTWTSDSAELARRVGETEATGGTAMYDHLHQAVLLLEQRQGRRVVLVLSDGWDLHSVLDFETVERLVRRSGVQIFWLRPAADVPRGRLLGPREGGTVRRAIPYGAWRGRDDGLGAYRAFEDLVEDTGGRIVSFESDADIEPALVGVLDELRSQYALGYYPTQRRGGGSWREVEIDVAGSGLRVRAPQGYVDRREGGGS
ncbi:MAG: VWA domain-containing protein [Acidobacteriota bacterium]